MLRLRQGSEWSGADSRLNIPAVPIRPGLRRGATPLPDRRSSDPDRRSEPGTGGAPSDPTRHTAVWRVKNVTRVTLSNTSSGVRMDRFRRNTILDSDLSMTRKFGTVFAYTPSGSSPPAGWERARSGLSADASATAGGLGPHARPRSGGGFSDAKNSRRETGRRSVPSSAFPSPAPLLGVGSIYGGGRGGWRSVPREGFPFNAGANGRGI